ncbi:hypothetical protein ACFQ4C_19100 [Larkinella insperata]|uniref:Flap endonuclease-1-like 5' DNA nuclease n=1 Tax=Larkinella insperata TaxID=332158 RepID=A0ABW3Q6N6_9BACT|nr:hypothetical protein [Larkinella insperata]
MFHLDPFNRGVAISEILLLLAFAALVGYFLARLLTNGRIHDLRARLAEHEVALDECQRNRKETTTSVNSSLLVPKPVFKQAATSEDAVWKKLASRASELNFNRIGYATLEEADDLKEIVGVGPFFERKLNTLGIHSFRQLANFTAEDVEKLSDIIEFFPDRIERENWVGQSKHLYAAKYGRTVQ